MTGLLLALLLADADANSPFTPDVIVPCQVQLHIENDTGSSDRAYTQGMRLALMNCTPTAFDLDRNVLRRLAHAIDHGRPGTIQESGFAVGQNIYTPRDERPEIDRDDRPYAAWLYLARIWRVRSRTNLMHAELGLGVIGPHALGEWTQNGWHDLIGDTRFQGWRHQVATAPIVQSLFMLQPEIVRLGGGGFDECGDRRGFHVADLRWHGRVQLGNALVTSALGVAGRMGVLRDPYGLYAPMPSLTAHDEHACPPPPRDEFWELYLFARAEGRLVGHNAFLQGAPGTTNPHVTGARRGVADGEWGAALSLGPVSMAFSYVFRSTEADLTPWSIAYHRYWQLQLSYRDITK